MGLSLRLLDFPYAQAWQLLYCLAHLQPCLGDWLVAGQTHLFVEPPWPHRR
ncbi:MAG: hypothetical protein ACN6QY_16155 [Pseudomonas sp.]|uniref:hypothetical protein n=1 Tax=Pseudomonas sp. TaxID=306 RepID=UPI000A4E6026